MCEKAHRTYIEILKELRVSFKIRQSQIVFQKFIGKLEVCFPPIHPSQGRGYQ